MANDESGELLLEQRLAGGASQKLLGRVLYSYLFPFMLSAHFSDALSVRWLAMHPFHWIYNNRELLQAISGLAIVGLTFVLIVLNAVYVRANWKTMRLMEADVRFRLKPIPHVGVAPSSAWDNPGAQVWTLTIRCDHAPMVLMATSIRFSIGGGKEFEHFHVFNGETIHPQTGRQYDLTIKMPAPAQTWSLDLYYRDLSQLLDYGTVFGPTGFVADLTTVDRKTPWNRVRFWFGVQAIKKRLGMK